MRDMIHSNDCSREAHPGVWIFRGRSAVFLVIGTIAFVALFRILAACDIDWYLALPISTIPLGVISLTVWVLRDKQPSYMTDWLLWQLWRVKTRMYFAGCLDRPPLLWIKGKEPTHPKDFNANTSP